MPVTLLEAHKDFDRDFRGDTIHASTLEVLDQIGLADRLQVSINAEPETRDALAPNLMHAAVDRKLDSNWRFVSTYTRPS